MAAVGLARSQVQSLDPRMPITNVLTIRQLFDQALWGPRMAAMLLAAFGGLALLLAALPSPSWSPTPRREASTTC